MLDSLLLAETRVVYELNRVQSLDQWWHWLVLITVFIALLSYFWVWYRRDTVELPKALGWGLLLLRIAALLGILFFFLDLQKRTEQRIVRPSKVAVLVDTSLSMALPADWDPGRSGTAGSRIDQVVQLLEDDQFIKQMRDSHELSVYRFDQPTRPTLIASLPKNGPIGDAVNQTSPEGLLDIPRTLSWIATAMATLALLGFLVGGLGRFGNVAKETAGYWTLLGIVTSISAVVVLAVAMLRVPEAPLTELWKTTPWTPPTETSADEAKGTDSPSVVDYSSALAATGAETRIGDAVKTLLEQERGNPLSAVVLMTDGRNNAGVDPSAAALSAQGQSVPIYTVGLGADTSPPNVRLVEMEAPKRVYPGDKFSIAIVVQGTAMNGNQVTARLRRRSAVDSKAPWVSEDELQLTLGDDDDMTSAQFEVEPPEIGRWLYDISLLVPQTDANEKDNSQAREVQVVERRNRVLIISSGPNREYQFVRNLLFRDKDVESHVFLQSGQPGMSQEAEELLTDFPTTREEMLKYDCVLAFDADWLELTQPQLEVLEQWVSDQAGGLVIVAGPVATPKWSGFGGSDRRVDILRGLAPVSLDARGTRAITTGRFESEKAWGLGLTPEGLQTDFLWLKDDRTQSEQAWSEFSGVYSYYACYEPKPAARVLAYFTDPTTGRNNQQPIYLASQFYGAGRVVFQGSGEIWRVRELSDTYFEAYYTKLVRWVSQGRLMRDSDRGILLLDREQSLVGEQIAVRAVLRDEQFQPLTDPEVKARLVDPQGKTTNLILRDLQDAAQPGVYVGQFLCEIEGTYEVQLPLGSLTKQEVLSQQVLARVPAREVQMPQRNGPFLTELATRTRGTYFAGINAAREPVGEQKMMALAASIAPQDQVTFLPGTPDRQFQLRLMGMLMALIGGALSIEWLIRRLNKLA